MLRVHADRRQFLAVFSRFGLASTLMPGALWAMAAAKDKDKPKITRQMIDDAAVLADVTIDDQQKDMMLDALNDQLKGFGTIHDLHIANSVQPALIFNPLLRGMAVSTERHPMRPSAPSVIGTRGVPKDIQDVAFYSVRQLAELVRTKKVSSSALTDLYLGRLKKYDPLLKFVITFTSERAIAQATDADAEIAKGKYCGLLHGIPWGCKDIIAVKGYPTTWGAGGFEKQTFDDDATIVKRLDAAGAVLIAKTSVGALAMGDKWFGAQTRNPWNPRQGSSGSSAGSASAVSAGCVGFAIGTETLGSISSPSTRCGTTGLRPTFGFVPRTGAMALSWSMDKIGAICRGVEDCALVLDAIHGPDQQDNCARDAAFNWDATLDWRKLRVGYLKSEFEGKAAAPEPEEKGEAALSPEEQKKAEQKRKTEAAAKARRDYDRRYDLAALEKLRSMGVQMAAVDLPDLPYDAMVSMLTAEAAAAFDELTRSGRDKLLTAQGPEDWPNIFRAARFIPAVEYVSAGRARNLAMQKMAALFQDFDVIVAPSSSRQLVVTNLTGHPALILPNGFRGPDAPAPPDVDTGDEDNIGGPGTPVSLTFLGGLYQEAKLLALARAYQEATDFHLKHPALDELLKKTAV